MARETHDREDLLAEATALVERASLKLPASGHEIVVGFRRDSSASFYLAPDCVYQFTSDAQLRRAFVGELSFKAERGRLVSLRRMRHEHSVELTRHVLDPEATTSFLEEMRKRLAVVRDALARRNFTLIGQVPADADMVGRIAGWLDELGGRVEIASSPRAR